MPDGSPIDQWWKSHRPPQVTTPAAQRICFRALSEQRTYCGHKPTVSVDDWSQVTCSKCVAARAADEENGEQS